MPICKNCNNSFPNSMKIRNKVRNLQRRKYCLECSPFNKHNTSKIHIIKDGERDRFLICKKCGREYIYNERKGHTLQKCNSCSVNARKEKIKKKAVEYKGGKCCICNYNKCYSALEFHHKNPEEKEFSLSGCHCYSWERIQNELDKCVCICCRCHRELHSGLITLKGSLV